MCTHICCNSRCNLVWPLMPKDLYTWNIFICILYWSQFYVWLNQKWNAKYGLYTIHGNLLISQDLVWRIHCIMYIIYAYSEDKSLWRIRRNLELKKKSSFLEEIINFLIFILIFLLVRCYSHQWLLFIERYIHFTEFIFN